MPLAPGTRLGAYDVRALIGAGGMGEVYRARDTKLNRDVALKILPLAFASDPDRLARFEREAQVLASLNHPHVGAIYGFENSAELRALVLELVEGPTLADRIVNGAPPLDETLRIAQQIAEALEAAHEKGIVHRDLKPANIKITANGIVKVLDFGLAKAASGETSSPDLSHSPTVTGAGTRAGVILGTAAYMSPEQARGKFVDKRADIWAFGCVLFEMLTGRALFARDTLTDTLAAVVQSDPDWQALAATTPARIRDLLRRCLQKDPQRRLRDIGDARLDIEDAIAAPLATGNVASAVDRRRVTAWVITGAVLASVVTASLLLLRQQPQAPAANFTLTIAPPSATGIQPVDSLRARPEISPDGSVVAYHDRMGTLQLRRLNAQSPEPLRPATGTATFSTMIWSSDSKYLVFPDGQTLKRVRVPDGAPEVVGRLPGVFPVGSLSDNGRLLFVCCQPGKVALFLVPEPGAEPMEISVPGLQEGTLFGPWFLPDGEDFLISGVPQGSAEIATYLVTLRDGKPIDPVLLTRNAAGIRYTPAGGGRVLFVRNDNL